MNEIPLSTILLGIAATPVVALLFIKEKIQRHPWWALMKGKSK